MPTAIQRWQASDGKIFNTCEEASRHEVNQKINGWLGRLRTALGTGNSLTVEQAVKLADFLKDNSEEIGRTLIQYAGLVRPALVPRREQLPHDKVANPS